MAFCSNCGAQINEGAQFCPQCGQPNNINSQQQVYNQQNVAQPLKQERSGLNKFLHSKWAWIAAIVLIIIIAASSAGGSSDTDVLEKEVKKVIVDKMKEKGSTLVITDFGLIHQEGNNFKGIASCTLDGEKIDLDVNVVYDGKKFQAEWAPTEEYQAQIIEEGLNALFGDYD